MLIVATIPIPNHIDLLHTIVALCVVYIDDMVDILLCVYWKQLFTINVLCVCVCDSEMKELFVGD